MNYLNIGFLRKFGVDCELTNLSSNAIKCFFRLLNIIIESQSQQCKLKRMPLFWAINCIHRL